MYVVRSDGVGQYIGATLIDRAMGEWTMEHDDIPRKARAFADVARSQARRVNVDGAAPYLTYGLAYFDSDWDWTSLEFRRFFDLKDAEGMYIRSLRCAGVYQRGYEDIRLHWYGMTDMGEVMPVTNTEGTIVASRFNVDL